MVPPEPSFRDGFSDPGNKNSPGKLNGCLTCGFFTAYGTLCASQLSSGIRYTHKEKEKMSARQSLLAEIEAKRLSAANKDDIEVLAAEVALVQEETGYDPYDRPGPAKPLDVDGDATTKFRPLKRKRRR
jgi:hypothetical protein